MADGYYVATDVACSTANNRHDLYAHLFTAAVVNKTPKVPMLKTLGP